MLYVGRAARVAWVAWFPANSRTEMDEIVNCSPEAVALTKKSNRDVLVVATKYPVIVGFEDVKVSPPKFNETALDGEIA